MHSATYDTKILQLMGAIFYASRITVTSLALEDYAQKFLNKRRCVNNALNYIWQYLLTKEMHNDKSLFDLSSPLPLKEDTRHWWEVIEGDDRQVESVVWQNHYFSYYKMYFMCENQLQLLILHGKKIIYCYGFWFYDCSEFYTSRI